MMASYGHLPNGDPANLIRRWCMEELASLLNALELLSWIAHVTNKKKICFSFLMQPSHGSKDILGLLSHIVKVVSIKCRLR